MNDFTADRFPRIPGFEITDRIGVGGFATVYRAKQPGLDRTVAIKVVHRSQGGDDEVIRRFRRECQAIGSLTGTPGVMTVFDLGTTSYGDPYLVLEYLEGGSLQDQLESDGLFTWKEIVPIATDLVRALGAAHDLGILHRDVKPANVLRDRYGNVRLGDFGIAHLAGVGDMTTGDTAMTVSYAAPEVLLGERATRASDYYSLGTLLYTLLAGRPPFVRPGDTSVALAIKRITSEPPPPLSETLVPLEMRRLVDALMAKSPNHRPEQKIVARTLVELSGLAARLSSSSGDVPASCSAPDPNITVQRPRTMGIAPPRPATNAPKGSDSSRPSFSSSTISPNSSRV